MRFLAYFYQMQKTQKCSSNNFLIFIFSYLVCQINVTPRLFFWRTNSHQHIFIWTTTPLDSPLKIYQHVYSAQHVCYMWEFLWFFLTPLLLFSIDMIAIWCPKIRLWLRNLRINNLHRVYVWGVFINFLGKFPTTHLFGAPLLFEEFLTDTFI